MSEDIQSAQDAQGIVLYTDGGCRPNPGPGGWGMHGYLFRFSGPKKGAGNPDHVLTDKGYVTKSNFALSTVAHTEVTPVHYVDGFGTFGFDVTNNIAELVAATNALLHAVQYDLKVVHIFTDSEYVRKGLESGVPQWLQNNWIKRDGEPVKNVSYWKQLIQARTQLLDRGVVVNIGWVQSHTDSLKSVEDILGNILADRLATIGVMTSRRYGENNSNIQTTKAEGYWNYSPDKHPFLNHRRMYFNTATTSNQAGEYYLGEHGKDDDLLGKRVSDGAFSLVRLETPDPILEMVREYQTELAKGTDNLMMARLDQIYDAETHKQLVTYGTRAMVQPNPFRLDLLTINNDPLTRELRPAKLALRAVDAIGELAEKLLFYTQNNPLVTITDLTPILYETTLKASKKGETSTITKLKPEYNVGYAALEVEANYRAREEISTASVILTLGIDMLDRNALKRLEELNPKVSLITWMEATDVFRYATIVEAGNDKGIWAGVYSNRRIIT